MMHGLIFFQQTRCVLSTLLKFYQHGWCVLGMRTGLESETQFLVQFSYKRTSWVISFSFLGSQFFEL